MDFIGLVPKLLLLTKKKTVADCDRKRMAFEGTFLFFVVSVGFDID